MINMIKWEIPQDKANYILQILANRPYQEVNELIQDLLKQGNQARPDLKEVEAAGKA